MNLWHFIKEALRDFRHIGSLFPSSDYAAKAVASSLPLNVGTIIEFGPGDGPVTRALLDRLPEDGRLVAVEVNEVMADKLMELGDHRLKVILGDAVSAAAKIKQLFPKGADAVVSGIPCSFLRPRKREAFIKAIYANLKSGGNLVAYQTSLRLFPLLKKYFAKTRWMLELRNLPIYFIMIATKQK